MTFAQELEYLALAVVQAEGYIFQSGCGLDRYLRMYRERRGGLLEEHRNIVQKVDDYNSTVYATWDISFKTLSEQLPFCSAVRSYTMTAFPKQSFRMLLSMPQRMCSGSPTMSIN